jgi:uncharacterized membrane protein
MLRGPAAVPDRWVAGDMVASKEGARRVGLVGAVFVAGGVALAPAILLRRDVVSPWWLAWAGYLILVGTLVVHRYRWSPELVASVFIFGAGYASWLLATRGANRLVAAIALLGTLGLMSSYPSLKREIRPSSPDE